MVGSGEMALGALSTAGPNMSFAPATRRPDTDPDPAVAGR
jgi:hypothetical protein